MYLKWFLIIVYYLTSEMDEVIVERMSFDENLEPVPKSKHRFEILRKLGSGTYGKVSLAMDHKTGEQVSS